MARKRTTAVDGSSGTMKVSSSSQRERIKSAEKPKNGGEPKTKGWRKAVEEDGSQVSDLSDSTDDGAEEESLGERSEDYENFEKTLRSKHSKACKAMSVCGDDIILRRDLFSTNILTLKAILIPRTVHTAKHWLISKVYYQTY